MEYDDARMTRSILALAAGAGFTPAQLVKAIVGQHITPGGGWPQFGHMLEQTLPGQLAGTRPWNSLNVAIVLGFLELPSSAVDAEAPGFEPGDRP